MIDYLSLLRLTNSWFGNSNAHNIPATGDAVIVGYCKCDGPIYEGILRAKVGGKARSVAVTMVVQTIIPKIFRAFFVFASGASTNQCPRVLTWSNRFMMLLLFALVVTMLALIFALKFDPQGWKNALLIS